MADITSEQATKITKYASDLMGTVVGKGECFDLVDKALTAAGALSAASYGIVTPTANYIWGAASSVGLAQAGDIVQFSNYQYVKTITTKIVKKDGSGSESFVEDGQGRPHHSAIVSSVEGNGVVTILEQNVGKTRKVMTNRLFFTTRAEPEIITTDPAGTTTTVTTVITVTGTTLFYRPQAAPPAAPTP